MNNIRMIHVVIESPTGYFEMANVIVIYPRDVDLDAFDVEWSEIAGDRYTFG